MRSTLIIAAVALSVVLAAPVPEVDGSICSKHPGLSCSGAGESGPSKRQPEPFGRGSHPKRQPEPFGRGSHPRDTSSEEDIDNMKRQPEPFGRGSHPKRQPEPFGRGSHPRDTSSEGDADNMKREPEPFGRGSHPKRQPEPFGRGSHPRDISSEADVDNMKRQPELFGRGTHSRDITDEVDVETRFTRFGGGGRRRSAEPQRGPGQSIEPVSAEYEDDDTEALEAQVTLPNHEARTVRGPRTAQNKRTPEADPINRINGEKRTAEAEPINRINGQKRTAEPTIRGPKTGSNKRDDSPES